MCGCQKMFKFRAHKSPRKTPRKLSKTRARKSPRKSRKNPRRRVSPKMCRQEVGKKIGINMKESKYVSKAQAIAVAYAQVKKAFPGCKKYV